MTTPNLQASRMSSTLPPNAAPGMPMQQPQPFNNERFAKPHHKDLEQIRDWAKQQFQSCKEARAGTERQWKLNLAFFFGRQNVVFRQPANFLPGQSGSLYVPPAPWYRSRPTINRIRPIVRKELSRLTSQKPTASVVPASTEDVDMYAARAGEQIWDSTYRRKNLKAEIRNTLFWTLTCGDGFLKTYWDPEIPDEDSDQMGDFCFDAETPFHILVPDLRQPNLEKQPYLIHASIKPKDAIYMKYPGLDLQKSRSGNSGREEILEDSYINLTGAGNVDDKKTVLVMEIWVKPNAIPLFPSGAMFTMVGDEIVSGCEGWPYIHKQFPFAKFGNIYGGKFYNDCVITDLIPLQREYNRTRGQIIEAKNRMAKPQLLAPVGSVDPRKITSEPGIVIEYQPGFDPPQPLPLISLPPYVLQELDRILLDMSDISGQHEISQGAVPPGVTAATAISYLQEQDESMMATTYDSMEEGVEKVASQTLALVSQFWDTERMVKVVGLDGSFEVLSFKGAKLASNTDIRVEAGSALPTSKAAKQAFIMDLMKMGFVDPQKGLEVMEIGGINKIYDELQVDIREAQRENIKMSKITPEQIQQFDMLQMQLMQTQAAEAGQMGMPDPADPTNPMPNMMTPPDGGVEGIDPMGMPRVPLIIPVEDWQNHRLHIEIHNKFRKGQAYDQMPTHVRELFDAHVKQHVDEIVMGQLAQVPPQVTEQMQAQGLDPATMGALQEADQNAQAAQQETQTSPDQAMASMMGGSANGASSSQPGA